MAPSLLLHPPVALDPERDGSAVTDGTRRAVVSRTVFVSGRQVLVLTDPATGKSFHDDPARWTACA